jgi:DNA repair exonuclease SbcCD nuclease subunit
MNFKFIHAADLHLDSPLIGLARKSAEFAVRVDDASRRAFDNLIALAIEEECSFVLIAGDIFDGDWKDYTTGLFFADRMRKLQSADIKVFVILGNHDADNRFAKRLDLSENVHLMSQRKAESVRLDDLGVVIHGRSFPQREVTDNLAIEYPTAVPGKLNIGLLHTACTGRDGHANYAPCTVEQLTNHGYDYWALGHVHTREVLQTDPYIVFPGNLQGRHPHETGEKGATLVEVDDGKVVSATHRPLDVVRWSNEILDVSAAKDINALYTMAGKSMEAAYDGAGGRSLAFRLRFVGTTELHHELVIESGSVREELETVAANIAPDIWIEKVEIATQPIKSQTATDPTVAGKLLGLVDEVVASDRMSELLEQKLTEVRIKMPAGAHVDELFEEIRSTALAGSRDLALSLIEKG